MGLSDNKENCTSGDIVEFMLTNAGVYLEQNMPEQAYSIYKQIAEMTDYVTALYNLGILCATGQGTEQNFLQAAYWFHRAYLCGDQEAKKLQTKSMVDYIHQNFYIKSPQAIYQEMIVYAELLYPEKSSRDVAVDGLYSLAVHHLNNQQYIEARKLFQSAARYGDHGNSQNYLGVMYNGGIGMEKNDLIALYWFDRAADNHIEAAKTDRDGILNSFRANYESWEFSQLMSMLSLYCIKGNNEVPQDMKKAAYWKSQG